jgi:hypothetical protein
MAGAVAANAGWQQHHVEIQHLLLLGKFLQQFDRLYAIFTSI